MFLYLFEKLFIYFWLHWVLWESKSCSVVPDSLWPGGVYSPWNSPGQNTRVGSLSLLQGIFPTQGSDPGLLHLQTDSLPAEPPEVLVALHRLFSSCGQWGYSLSWCTGFSLRWLLLLRIVDSGHMGSVAVACRLWNTAPVVIMYELSCSSACGIFPDQGSNLCPLHWLVDFYPLCHRGSPGVLEKASLLSSTC